MTLELNLESYHPGSFSMTGWIVNSFEDKAVFDLREATSTEAEEALVRARALLRSRSPDPGDVREVDVALQRLLPDLDPFFVRWGAFVEGVIGVGA